MEIINQIQLNECMTGDTALDQDLIRSVIDEITRRSQEMRESLTNQDHEAWRIATHSSTGVVATLGFSALADQFRKAEHDTHTDFERAAALNRIHELIDQTRNQLSQIGLLKPDGFKA